jgi:hypothetical protein
LRIASKNIFWASIKKDFEEKLVEKKNCVSTEESVQLFVFLTFNALRSNYKELKERERDQTCICTMEPFRGGN